MYYTLVVLWPATSKECHTVFAEVLEVARKNLVIGQPAHWPVAVVKTLLQSRLRCSGKACSLKLHRGPYR